MGLFTLIAGHRRARREFDAPGIVQDHQGGAGALDREAHHKATAAADRDALLDDRRVHMCGQLQRIDLELRRVVRA